ncbi:uncharacterized protein LOC123318351 [Coccinella septempunctata]|uniref:uncharacterized protein LOC123318351 n=1 Tax=Coccinella septempunctata TaxID=41139 RepID=UPI001D083DB6|nr:uncharacterized protein LOC123318351 [Coccinella septempunctata]
MENISSKNRGASASAEQKKLLLDYMKKHPDLLSAKFSKKFTMKDARKLWVEISNILNTCDGANKDWKSWRKTWHDIRSRTKTKCARKRSYGRGTSRGTLLAGPSGDFEREVLEVITNVPVEGDTSICEPNSYDQFEDNKDPQTSTAQSEVVERIAENVPISVQQNISETAIHPPLATFSNIKSRTKAQTQFIHASEASERCETSLEEENRLKEDYYKKKIAILERIAVAKEKSAAAKERIACALEEISRRM